MCTGFKFLEELVKKVRVWENSSNQLKRNHFTRKVSILYRVFLILGNIQDTYNLRNIDKNEGREYLNKGTIIEEI